MIAYIGRRLLLGAFVLFGATVITFTISRVLPADPVRIAAGLDADQQTVEQIRRQFGLDRPLPAQYFVYMKGLIRGDLGRSLASQRPVSEELASRFPATLELAVVTIIVYSVLGISLGVLAGMSARRWVDNAVRILALIAYSMPQFWLGLVFQLLFFGQWHILPVAGRIGSAVEPPHQLTGLYLVDSLLTFNWSAFRSSTLHLVLPVLTLVLSQVGLMVRLVRIGVLDVRGRDFVRTARAKGLSERAVAYRHVLKNALLPVVTMLGMQFGWLLSGTIVVETIFGWPGVGRYAVDSVLRLDYNPVLGVTLVGTVAFLLVNLIVDVLYVFLDPRIRVA